MGKRVSRRDGRGRTLWERVEGERASECTSKRGTGLGCAVCSRVDSAPGTRLQATSICCIPSILSLPATIATVLPTDPTSLALPPLPAVHPTVVCFCTLGPDTTSPTTITRVFLLSVLPVLHKWPEELVEFRGYRYSQLTIHFSKPVAFFTRESKN